MCYGRFETLEGRLLIKISLFYFTNWETFFAQSRANEIRFHKLYIHDSS